MSNRFFHIFLLSYTISACTQGGARTEPEPVPAEAASAVPSAAVSSRTSWIFTPSSKPRKYKVTTRTIVDQSNSTILRDSLTTTAAFTLSLTRDSRSLSYNATIEAFSIQASSRIGLTVTPDHFPVSVSGRLEANRFSGEVASECSSQGSIITPAIQRLVSPIPLQLQKDQTWTDSISSNICSGSIPVALTAVRTYRVLGEAEVRGVPVIRLSREDRTTSQGEGSEGQHRIRIETEGTGRGELLVDRGTGSLIESSTANVLMLTIKTSGQTQRFTQTSQESVVEQ